MFTKDHLITHFSYVILWLSLDMFSLGGIAVMTEATEDDLSKEEDVHLKAANFGKMLYM